MSDLLALQPIRGVEGLGNVISEGGQGLFQAIQTRKANDRQNALLDMQSQTHGQNMQSRQLKLNQEQGRALYNHAVALKGMDVSQRARALGELQPELLKLGFSEDDIADGLDDNELDFAVNALSRFAMQDLNDKSPTQFGAQSTFKDDQGNLFFGTTARDPDTGAVKTVLAPVGDGPEKPVGKIQQAGQYGLTAPEKVQQNANEKAAELTASSNAEERASLIKQGNSAKGMIRTTNKLLELNKLITTGKTAKARKFLGDLFGVTDPDLGQFNALAGKLVLDNIRALGANPTEGERAFLQQITPSIEQGGAVNEAILKDMLEVQKRQVERAKWLIKNPDKTVEEFMLLNDDFEPETNLDTQGSPAADFDSSLLEHMTPEERALFE